MRLNRSMVLFVLACLTICFLGAAYTLWFNPAGLPLVGAGGLPTEETGSVIGITGGDKGVKLTVTEAGVAAVTATQLQNASLTFSELSSKELSLTRDGTPVPFLVRQDNEETTLYFYAEAEENPHEPLVVYEIKHGIGIDMLERDAQPFNEGEALGQHLLDWEDNRLFVKDGTPGDAWMGPILLAPDRWTLHLDTIEPDGKTATLAIRLFTNVETESNDQHHVEVQVNDQSVAEHYWQGSGQETIRVPVQEGILKPNDRNIVSVDVYDDTAPQGEAIYIDSLELAYEGPIDVSGQAVTFTSKAPNIRVDGANDDLLVLDISNPAIPVVLNGIRPDGDSVHFSPGAKNATLIALNPQKSIKPDLETTSGWDISLREPGWGADYIIVLADVRGFDETIAPLVLHRQEDGFRVATIPVEQIYNEFGYGHRDPQAIKDFIAFAIENWESPAPRYVLLAGDATYDVTNQVPGKNRNRLPTQIVYTLDGGYVANDAWFTADEENASQVAIGRFPAQNAPQLRAMVKKTIEYEQELAGGNDAWIAEALLVADDETKYDEEIADLGGYLESNGYSVYRLHMSHDDNTHHKIISAINEGVGIVNYMGYGSAGAWSDQAVFQNSDAQVLQNGKQLPILNTFTCRSGSFANPRTDSLAESLLRANHGGIIAAIAPSGNLAEEYQSELTRLFYEQFMAQDEARLGDSLLNMYNAAGKTPLLQEAMSPINLLGDPALIVEKPNWEK